MGRWHQDAGDRVDVDVDASHLAADRVVVRAREDAVVERRQVAHCVWVLELHIYIYIYKIYMYIYIYIYVCIHKCIYIYNFPFGVGGVGWKYPRRRT